MWGNSAASGDEIAVGVPAYPSVVDINYSDVNRATGAVVIDAGSIINWNAGVINTNPLFTSVADYYLRQIAAGQSANSPCVDTGSDFASRFGLHKYTTRTDGERDIGIVDMGYHYPLPAASCSMFDYTGDENVNFDDFAEFALFWLNEGCSDTGGWCQGRDVTFDGAVDVFDLADFSPCWLYGVVHIGGGDTTPPTPNPMQWAIPPAPATESSVTMTAETATDNSGGLVWYEFQETTGNPGGTSSGWQTSPVYTDTGLQAGSQYCYMVRARDESSNTTGWSPVECVSNVGDINAPSPAPIILPAVSNNTNGRDVNTASEQFQWDPDIWEWDWWQKIVVDVTGIIDDNTPATELEVRFICSNSTFSSNNVIPSAYRPIRIGHPVAIASRVLDGVGIKDGGYRLTWNGANQIVYDVYLNTSAADPGLSLNWVVGVYDAAGNVVYSTIVMIPPAP